MTVRSAAAIGVCLGLLAATRALGEDGPSEADIARAISGGVSNLKERQEPKGNWSYQFNQDHTLGITALAGLALLENGVKADDPVIGSAAEVVQVLAPRSGQTYDLALAILFLARVQQEGHQRNDALIRRLASRLEGGGEGGMWAYTVPVTRDEDAPGRRGRRPVPRMRRAFEPGDNSNTQFALLGIWAAGRHEFDANAGLEAIDAHFRGTQNPDGHWGYHPNEPAGESMTCAGLMALAMGASRPSLAERQTARARGAALAADPIFVAALKAVTKDAQQLGPQSDIYYLWSLERVCVALGLRRLDEFDWYAAGARTLLQSQRPDGSWPDGRWGSLPNTCLALLFLRKANLAFELDRVLRLPGAGRAERPGGPAEKDAPASKAEADAPSEGAGDRDVQVLVTGASELKFPEIAVDFEVKRPDGSYLLDASAGDFHVTEYDQPVSILSLKSPIAREALPTTVVLVVDRSRSMEEEDRIGNLKRAVASFVRGLPKGSRVAVVAFGSEVETICPFTDDPTRVRESVDSLTPSGATRYYDAVAAALEMLAKESGRRALLAMTDGEDTFSQSANLDSTVLAARRLGLPIHTLGLGSEDEIESESLRRMARETRGQYYPARQADQLRAIYEQLAERLRSTYTLVYKSDRKLPDGTLRPVRISYRASRQAGEAKVFIPGMVVPASGWPRLFLALVGLLLALAVLPGRLARRPTMPPRP